MEDIFEELTTGHQRDKRTGKKSSWNREYDDTICMHLMQNPHDANRDIVSLAPPINRCQGRILGKAEVDKEKLQTMMQVCL